MRSTPDRDADARAAIDAVRRIVRALRLADREIEAACGISVAQLFVLHQLAAAPGLSLAELAARVLTDQSSVSTVVARLVATGHVARRPAEHDRRRAELRLTARGQRALAKAPPLPQLKLIDAVRALPPRRRRELVRALDTVATALGGGAARMLFEDECAGIRATHDHGVVSPAAATAGTRPRRARRNLRRSRGGRS